MEHRVPASGPDRRRLIVLIVLAVLEGAACGFMIIIFFFLRQGQLYVYVRGRKTLKCKDDSSIWVVSSVSVPETSKAFPDSSRRRLRTIDKKATTMLTAISPVKRTKALR